LAYHVGLSIAAAIVWFLATKFCWPAEDEPAPAAVKAEGDAQ